MGPERRLEQRLVRRVHAIGGWAVKLGPLYYAGLPDRLVLLPGGKVIFVEMKAPGGRLSKKQAHVGAKLRDLGFVWVVLSSAAEVDQFVESDACSGNLSSIRGGP